MLVCLVGCLGVGGGRARGRAGVCVGEGEERNIPVVCIDGRADESVAAENGIQGCLDDRVLPNFAKCLLENLSATASELRKADAGLIEARGVVELAQELQDFEFVIHHFWGVAGVKTSSCQLCVPGTERGTRRTPCPISFSQIRRTRAWGCRWS